MSDGDLILQLGFEHVPPFEMGSCGTELYEAMAPLAHDDEQHGWPLARLCEALGRMRQPVSDLVRSWEEDGVPALDGEGRDAGTVTMQRSGWSRAAHPSRGPGRAPDPRTARGHIDLLPFIGQLVGVRGIERLSDEDRREAIRRREGWSRGQPASIRSFAQRFMVDDSGDGVTLRERYDPLLGSDVDAPYRGRVLLKRSRIRDLARENLIPNPKAKFDTSHVSVDAPGMLGATLSRSSNPFYPAAPEEWVFSASARQPSDSTLRTLAMAFGGRGRAGVPVIGGLPYTISAATVGPVDESQDSGPDCLIRWAAQWYDADGEELSRTQLPGEQMPWVLLSWSGTFVAPARAAYAQFRLEYGTTVPGDTLAFVASGLLLEQSSRAHPYGDADTPGWFATGVPHASPSRSAGRTAHEIATELLRQIPAGLIYDVVISDGLDYDELAARVDGRAPTYADVETRYTNYTDLLEG